MMLETNEPRHLTWLSRTDDRGVTTVETPIVPLVLSVLPERLQDPAVQQPALRQGDEAFADQRLELGRFAATSGQTTEIEVKLPAAWRR